MLTPHAELSARFVHCTLVWILLATALLVCFSLRCSSVLVHPCRNRGVPIFSANPHNTLDHPHAVIGVVLAVISLEIVFTSRCMKLRSTGGTKRQVWEIAHRWTRRMIAVMEIINCSLGMLLYGQ